MTKQDRAAIRYPSPLRYPGGKAKVANFLKLVILENELVGIRYLEPYAGGASVALSLLFEGLVSQVQINDLNPGIYAFWRDVVTHPDGLCRKIYSAKLDLEEWARQKHIYSDPASSPSELAFATFYLNRTNRSGIITRGGVIGGIRQEGHWKMDARFPKEALVKRIEKVAAYSENIRVTSNDAAELIKSLPQESNRKLIYLDPPYYVKGARLYDNYFTHADHVNQAEVLASSLCNWIVSYDEAPEVVSLYRAHRSLSYRLDYSASTASSGREIMFFSPGLTIPSVDTPASVPTRLVNTELKASRARGRAVKSETED